MPRYEWRGSDAFQDNRNDREIDPGETVTLSEHVAGGHPEFVPVEDEDADESGSDGDDGDTESDGGDQADVDEAVDEVGDDAEADSGGGEPTLDPHPDDLTVPELEARVEDVDDVATLEAIREAEEADGSPRTTALEAIDARIDAVSE